jgi:cytochrome c oxidase subunit 1
MKLALVLYFTAFTGIVLSVIKGFGAGWTFLYPLSTLGQWSGGTAALFLFSVTIAGIGYLILFLSMLASMAGHYGGVHRCLGWHLLLGEKSESPPPIVIISSVALVVGLIAVLNGAAYLILNLLHLGNYYALRGGLSMLTSLGVEGPFFPDPLRAKNMLFMFGHCLMNISIFFGAGVVYAVLPKFTRRPWKSNNIVAAAWNTSMIMVILAMWHHLYMDFVQPLPKQFLGQVGSFGAAIPALTVTIFGTLLQVYRSGIKWLPAPLFMYLAIMAWVIGGLAAVIDATIGINFTFHNTLWVPAHFHTYLPLGVLMILVGFMYYFMGEDTRAKSYIGSGRTGLALALVGGYGFAATFYLSGLLSVPRRFADYALFPEGVLLAKLSVVFILIEIAGILLIAKDIFSGMPARSRPRPYI